MLDLRKWQTDRVRFQTQGRVECRLVCRSLCIDGGLTDRSADSEAWPKIVLNMLFQVQSGLVRTRRSISHVGMWVGCGLACGWLSKNKLRLLRDNASAPKVLRTWQVGSWYVLGSNEMQAAKQSTCLRGFASTGVKYVTSCFIVTAAQYRPLVAPYCGGKNYWQHFFYSNMHACHRRVLSTETETNGHPRSPKSQRWEQYLGGSCVHRASYKSHCDATTEYLTALLLIKALLRQRWEPFKSSMWRCHGE